MSTTVNTRLESLDILRGFDLFLLLMFQPFIVALLTILDLPALEPLLRQFEHAEWQGFTFWDIIMPLFMFMSGITIPFAFARYKKGERVDARFWLRLGKRFLILFALGWVVQGNILALDVCQFRIFSNTLQSIAIGYVGAAVCFVLFSLRTQLWVAVLLFVSYIGVFTFVGGADYSPEGNVAELIDRAVLGSLRDGVSWEGNSWSFSTHYHYTWVLSSLNFVVTVMMGLFAGTLLYDKRRSAMRKFFWLAGIGVALVGVGWALHPLLPVIKKIWSSSMTLVSGGYCFLLMALFYYVVDVKGWGRGLRWLRYYGLNSIVAYCLYNVVQFTSISDSLFYGLEQYMGAFYPLVGVSFQAGVVFYIVYYLYRKGLFFKA